MELAAAIIIRPDIRKLLLVRNIKHGKIRMEPPGGKIEHGESSIDCAVRETRDEIGLDIIPLEPMGTYFTDSPEGRAPVHMFYCRMMRNAEFQLKEPGKIDAWFWYNRKALYHARDSGLLVPNMCAALKDLGDRIC